MTSKLEYLQRYMSGSGADAGGEEKKKKKVKKVKKTKSAALGTRVVDADDVWEHTAPSKEDIDKKWEMDIAEDEQPMVIAADGDDLVDAQDLPVYVNSDKYLDDFQGRKKGKKVMDDGDLSPPRKKRGTGRCKDEYEGDEASPPRRPKKEDASPPRRRSKAAQRASERQGRDRDEDRDDTVPSKGQGREQHQSEEGSRDASPPRRRICRERGDGALQSSSVKKESTVRCPPADQKVDLKKIRTSSPLGRSRRLEDESKRDERRRRYSSSESPAAPDRQRRVDSLGRDVPPRPIRSKRRFSSVSREDNSTGRHRDRKVTRSGSRDRSADTSPPRERRRRSRSQSLRTRRRRDSRSPSIRRRSSSKRSTRWSSPRCRRSTHDRSHSRSRSKRRSASPSRRSHQRSHSPDRRSLRHETLDTKEERRPDSNSSACKNLRTTTKSPSCNDRESESREIASGAKVKNEPETKVHDEKNEKKAGLFTAAEFDRQRKTAAKRKDILNGVDASELGANAKTVYRDKRGRKLDMLNEMVRQQEVLEGKRKREEREEYEWGTGEVQKRERKSQQELMEQMKNTPFARHDDDAELERKRRERVRAFDPMNSKIFQEDLLAESKSDKKSKSKKDKKKMDKNKPKYAGPPAPPNRFGIVPGYRWDGVVRGTNWEEKIMMRQNANAAVSEEAYKYAVADM